MRQEDKEIRKAIKQEINKRITEIEKRMRAMLEAEQRARTAIIELSVNQAQSLNDNPLTREQAQTLKKSFEEKKGVKQLWLKKQSS